MIDAAKEGDDVSVINRAPRREYRAVRLDFAPEIERSKMRK